MINALTKFTINDLLFLMYILCKGSKDLWKMSAYIFKKCLAFIWPFSQDKWSSNSIIGSKHFHNRAAACCCQRHLCVQSPSKPGLYAQIDIGDNKLILNVGRNPGQAHYRCQVNLNRKWNKTEWKLTCYADRHHLHLWPPLPFKGAGVDSVVMEGGGLGDEAQVWVEGELDLILKAVRLVMHDFAHLAFHWSWGALGVGDTDVRRWRSARYY